MKRLTAEKRGTRAGQLSFRVVNPGMFFSIISLVIACLVPAQVTAATFYVNGSCPTNGNGRGASCAASSGGAGAWSSLNAASHCSGMGPGDILEIRGGTYNEASWQPRTGCSGYSGNNVIIQNYAGEDVILDGTRDISGSTWTSRGGGVYECTSGTCGTTGKFPFTAWYDRGAGEERLDLVQTNRTCDSSVPSGGMRYTSGGAVCAHLSDGSSPGNASYFDIPTEAAAMRFQNTGADYITLRKNPAGGSFTIERFRDHGIEMNSNDNKGIKLDGLTLRWMMDRCINSTQDSPDVGIQSAGFEFRNNDVSYCGQEGIRIDRDSGSPVVENNTVHHIQNEPEFERCLGNCINGFTDNGTGIRAARLDNAIIRDNIVYDIGGGQFCRSYGIDLEDGITNTLIDSNQIWNMNHGCSEPNNGQAILLSQTGSKSYDGTVIQNNRIHNVDVCFSVDAVIPGGDVIEFFNNTCSDPSDDGFQQQDGPHSGTISIVNNIFRATGTTPNLLVDVNNGGFTQEYNSYYCTTCSAGGGDIIDWMGSKYERDGDCTPSTNCVEDLDANSDYGDPNVDITGNPPSLKILSMSGTAYDRGSNFGSSMDFEDEPRAMSAAWDIGADEFGGGGSPSGPTSPPNPPVGLRVLQ
jgi:hypothetical protein